MRFRFFRPLHGWREFIHEIVIVVTGVLLALAGAQLIESFHDRAELRDAQDAMTSELRDDDLPQAFTRVAIDECYAGQMNAIESAIASGDRAKFLTLAGPYKPVFRTWDDEAWKAAVASKVLDHVGSRRMISWSSPYILIPFLRQTALEEADELAQLQANLASEGPLSAAQEDRLFEVVSVLRRLNRSMSVGSLVVM